MPIRNRHPSSATLQQGISGDYNPIRGTCQANLPQSHRFHVPYWQKFERLLAKARSLGIIVQITFFTDAQEAVSEELIKCSRGDNLRR